MSPHMDIQSRPLNPADPRAQKVVPNENRIVLKGCAKHARFYAAREFLNKLSKAKPNGFHHDIEIHQLNEMDYAEFRILKKREKPDIVDALYPSCVIEVYDEVGKTKTSKVMNLAELISLAKARYGFEVASATSFDDENLVKSEYAKFIQSNKNRLAYMDISIDGQPEGRLVFELYSDVCPKTVENFMKYVEKVENEPCYEGCEFDRSIPNGFIEGGEIKNENGQPIDGPILEDENFIIEHSHRGMLSMVNSGPHSNFTKFMILFAGHMPYFDRKYVAFGRVIEGEETLAKLEAVETRFERPKRFITIAKSGSYREILESSS